MKTTIAFLMFIIKGSVVVIFYLLVTFRSYGLKSKVRPAS